jgi:tripartite ATP-independent transporter DctP family solute receptor
MPAKHRLVRGQFAVALAAMGSAQLRARSAVAAESYTLRMSVAGPNGGSMVDSGLQFAQAVHRRTNGQVTIETYPNAQLAKQEESIDAMANGVIDLAMVSSSFLVPRVPRFQIFDVPFLFKDIASAFKVMNGPLGNEFLSDLESKGVLGLTWGTAGFKELGTTNRVVTAPEDMKGLRIRIASGPVFVATYQALGAIPVALDTSETFTALTQHTIDGMDNALWVVSAGKFYTVIKHVAMLNLILSVVLLMGSKRRLEALPANLLAAVRDEGKRLTGPFRVATDKQNADAVQILKANGVQFTEGNYAVFRRAVEPVYAMVQARLGGDLLERVSKTASA